MLVGRSAPKISPQNKVESFRERERKRERECERKREDCESLQ